MNLMKRVQWTISAVLMLPLVIGASDAQAAFTVVADYTFDDSSALNPFTKFGNPSVSDGQLQLDGASFLTIADPLGGASDFDRYVVEVLVTASSLNVFDFVLARSKPTGIHGGNNGQGLLFQDFGGGPGQISAINSFAGSATSFELLKLDTPTAVAVVQTGLATELYINGNRSAASISVIQDDPDTLAIGTHLFDGAAGAFNGSIDRVRLSTYRPGDFDSSLLLVPIPEPQTFVLSLLCMFGVSLGRNRQSPSS